MKYEYEQDPNEGMTLAALIIMAGIAAVVAALMLIARSRGSL